ncbi:Site-specific recombinase XerD [Methylobacterium sp. 190mf]|uniref:tyrosine-type recombinase/integrase n=1 Tax=Methylobacterium sp. 190mf TaxID=1761798 RepID=UPI00089EDAF2|nr:site-specific integrase [Methylobacterium sp. 190mf]SEG57028.1 Site-specific recombinase XerD [Methylobacterium sp. 190mf]
MSKAPELKKHANGKFYIHWIDGRRTRRASTGKSEMAAAQIYFGEWLINEQRAARDPKGAGLDFADVWAFYAKEALPKLVSGENTARSGRHLLEAFGDLPVADIGQAHLDDYVRDRRAGRIGRPAKLSTIWLEVAKLKAAVNFAIKRRKLPATARLELDSLEPPEVRDRWLRPEEVDRIIAEAETRREGGRLSRAERFLHLAIETAARRAVIENLQWDQVDLEAGVIHYHRHGDLRSKKKRPSVPISSRLRPILERAYEERITSYVLDTSSDIYHHIERIARAADVKGFHPHLLRHTAATWMARRGVPLWKIAGILGNTMQMVEQVYAKHSPDGLADAVEHISAARKPAQAVRPNVSANDDLGALSV